MQRGRGAIQPTLVSFPKGHMSLVTCSRVGRFSLPSSNHKNHPKGTSLSPTPSQTPTSKPPPPSALISTTQVSNPLCCLSSRPIDPREDDASFPTMEIETVRCECCGLKEDCTMEYITEVKVSFGGKWLCGLCSEAARDELGKGKRKKRGYGVEEAVKAHISFCRRYKSNPAIRVADGMKQMLRRSSSGAFPRSRS